MKRSHAIVLGGAGMLMVAGLLVDQQSSDKPTEAVVYADANECKSDGKLTPTECEEQWSKAKEQQLAAAPKFKDKTECEKSHGSGQCQQSTWNGASIFAPAMIGYMLGRMTGQGASQAVTQPLYPAGAAAACPPGVDPKLRPDCAPRTGSNSGSSSSTAGRTYSSRSSSWRTYSTGSGGVVVRGDSNSSSGANAVTTRSAARALPSRSSITSRSSTVSRGGFGSTARGFSSGS
jgi:uncharacterized protein YgiB involved in biofilm formation